MVMRWLPVAMAAILILGFASILTHQNGQMATVSSGSWSRDSGPENPAAVRRRAQKKLGVLIAGGVALGAGALGFDIARFSNLLSDDPARAESYVDKLVSQNGQAFPLPVMPGPVQSMSPGSILYRQDLGDLQYMDGFGNRTRSWIYPQSEIRVSSTGIATQSPLGIMNDGADYGVDTVGTSTMGGQEAVNFLGTGAGVVKFLQGTFTLTSTLTIANSGVLIRGTNLATGVKSNQGETPSNFGTTLTIPNGANIPVIAIGSPTNHFRGWSLQYITIDGNKANQSGSPNGINIYAANGWMEQVEVRKVLGNGVVTFTTSPADSGEDFIVLNSSVHDCGSNGYLLQHADARLIYGNVFANGGSGLSAVSGAGGIIVSVVNFYSNGQGVSVDGTTGFIIGDRFVGCSFDHNNNNGMILKGGIYNLTVSANSFWNNSVSGANGGNHLNSDGTNGSVSITVAGNAFFQDSNGTAMTFSVVETNMPTGSQLIYTGNQFKNLKVSGPQLSLSSYGYNLGNIGTGTNDGFTGIKFLVGTQDDRVGLTGVDASPITIYTVGATDELLCFIIGINITTYGSGTVSYQLKFTDTGSNVPTMATSRASAGVQPLAPWLQRAKAGTAVTVQVTGAGSLCTFNVSATVEKVQNN